MQDKKMMITYLNLNCMIECSESAWSEIYMHEMENDGVLSYGWKWKVLDNCLVFGFDDI